MKISFIGYGNIVKAMIQGLSNNPNYQLYAASPSCEISKTPEGVITHHDNLAVLDHADMIILGVKPALIAMVLEQIKPYIPADCLLVSLAAGVNLSALESYCTEKQSIVRAMPNIPVAVQKGATPLIANQYLNEGQAKTITQLFQHIGIAAWTNQEQDLDIFTALSGSGPAYVFLFMEAMINAAKQLGLSETLSKTFTLQTVAGAVHTAELSPYSLLELRQQVTSPGGTTAAAIETLKQHGFEQALSDAVNAAYCRAVETSACTHQLRLN